MPSTFAMHRQGGAALIVGLIMLVLITLAVTAGFTLSNTNLKSVGNMQNRNEAVAASNRAIEEVATSLLLPGVDGSPSLVAPKATASLVDINNDGKNDYTVQIAAPTCVRATKSTDSGGGGNVGPGGITGGVHQRLGPCDSARPIQLGLGHQHHRDEREQRHGHRGAPGRESAPEQGAVRSAVLLTSGLLRMITKTNGSQP
ncbi:pilus assembly PilX family protein [Variovorax sp. S12S4]